MQEMAKQKSSSEPQPGDMVDNSILVDTECRPVSHIRELLDMDYWKQHALVDLPGYHVRKLLADTNLRIKHLRDQAGMHGYYLSIGVVQYDLNLEELRIAVQLRSGRKIIQYFQMTRGGWSYGVGRGAWQPHLRADVFLNKLLNDREHRSWEKFIAHHETIEHCVNPLADCVRLAGTARDECFCVDYGLPCVMENLHDTGVMLFVNRVNGFVLPASLAEMQEQHDRVFHSQHSPSDD
jgi:hypothetical protein